MYLSIEDRYTWTIVIYTMIIFTYCPCFAECLIVVILVDNFFSTDSIYIQTFVERQAAGHQASKPIFEASIS